MNRRTLLRTSVVAFAALLLLGPSVARGQMGHPLPVNHSPLHRRLAAADVVALVVVESVVVGRIRVRLEEVVIGSVDEVFEIKRSPTNPPPLSAGDRALLFLAGARPPYVLVEKPKEILVLNRAHGASALRLEATRLFLDSQDDPSTWVTLYLDWLAGEDPTLRELGLQGLADTQAPFYPLSPGMIEEQVEATLAPVQPMIARRASATLASSSPEGARLLLDRLLAAVDADDPSLLGLAIRGVLTGGGELGADTFLRTLRHEQASVRRTGISTARLIPKLDAAVVAEIERVAREDPDARTRLEAERTLKSIQQRRPRP